MALVCVWGVILRFWRGVIVGSYDNARLSRPFAILSTFCIITTMCSVACEGPTFSVVLVGFCTKSGVTLLCGWLSAILAQDWHVISVVDRERDTTLRTLGRERTARRPTSSVHKCSSSLRLRCGLAGRRRGPSGRQDCGQAQQTFSLSKPSRFLTISNRSPLSL